MGAKQFELGHDGATVGDRMTANSCSPDMRTVVRAACLRAGIRADREPLRLSVSAVYRLPGGLVARVHRPDRAAAARRVIVGARWLRASGVGAVQPVSDIDQPVRSHGHAVTFWHELPPYRPGTPAEVAAALAHLHALPQPTDLELGLVEPFGPLEQRIRCASALGDADRRWLGDQVAWLRDRWRALPGGRPWTVIHGNATPNAVIVTRDGRVLLRNLDQLAIGPPEWDLVPTALELVSLGWTTTQQYAEFTRAYGHDVLRWAGYFLLRDIRELHLVTRAAQAALTHPGYRGQALHRLSCLRGDEGPRPWPGWRRLPARSVVAAMVIRDAKR
ncbi:aminoglycoside phosphotransferase family protein [Nocardia sp. CDC159]|uniref:Aminoglycoside phosphotransferase family protein n=1 Tax=Nocardia pulmonis TaxID=2951408 RepID=A0A9X2IWW1_9NOCA|nr:MULTISPECIES: phosphotransferase [Nocardia]MCM6772286.1 aminoglycoside phosphotransferase family protein [Nocardia pulmonis]MCM6785056.1 aminoglycoside phosphotransferase family protein [Nocardia sp. CDC159]